MRLTVSSGGDRSTRADVSTSATRIRADVLGAREFLAPEVHATFVERVVLLGGESSGKSTLARALAGHFETELAVQPHGGRCREEWKFSRSGGESELLLAGTWGCQASSPGGGPRESWGFSTIPSRTRTR